MSLLHLGRRELSLASGWARMYSSTCCNFLTPSQGSQVWSPSVYNTKNSSSARLRAPPICSSTWVTSASPKSAAARAFTSTPGATTKGRRREPSASRLTGEVAQNNRVFLTRHHLEGTLSAAMQLTGRSHQIRHYDISPSLKVPHFHFVVTGPHLVLFLQNMQRGRVQETLISRLQGSHKVRFQRGYSNAVSKRGEQSLILPLQFWTAPWLSGSLGIDSKTLVLTRSSNKLQYTCMIIVFTQSLRYASGLEWRKSIFHVLLCGFCCGLVHHAALFAFGMRGYSDPLSLSVTLLTEWPAQIAGLAVFKLLVWKWVCQLLPFLSLDTAAAVDFPNDAFLSEISPSLPSGRGTKLFTAVLWLSFAALLYPHLAAIDDKDAMAYMIPLISGEEMQTLGTAYLRARTCIIPKFLPARQLQCWSDGSGGGNTGLDMLVLASAAKSGAVLSARLVAEIGTECGLCVASGERSGPGIPGPVEDLPAYDGRLLLAIINMRTWPEYVQRLGYNVDSINSSVAASDTVGRVRCVTLIREPLSRLRSLYTYARSGGEHWFRYRSGLMQALSNQSISVEQSVDLFWNTFGRGYLIQSHEYMMMNIHLGCKPVMMEAFKSNYTETIAGILHAYGINPHAIPYLVDKVASSDVSRKTEDEQKADAHVTANKFSSELVARVKKRLLDTPEVQQLIFSHRAELGYA